uniref:Protein kinase domain-containing protein n=1 Tax=viral metagenome TaxID=1070528 RepID=A0A6C0BT39_9ZZZZ
MFQLNYRKNRNVELFKDIQEKMGVSKVQNYMPVYQHYFSLNNTNYNSMNLNTFKSISRIETKIDENTYKTDVGVVHVKYAPLYDTYKYMVGKLQDISVNVLPSFDVAPTSENEKKLYDNNNSSYTDGFFYFLSSILLNQHGFTNAIDFYGSYLCIKRDFKLNIADDAEMLYSSDFFNNNRGKLFNVNSDHEEQYARDFTRNCKKRLELGETIDNRSVDSLGIIDNLNEMFVEDEQTTNNVEEENVTEIDNVAEIGEDSELPSRERGTSECSSRYSNSSEEDSTKWEDIETDSSESESESEDGDIDAVIEASISEFPANMIFIEKMEGTLDSLLEKMDKEELTSALFQVIMTLSVYNKAFDFTHNDLHTNNVMYVKTNIKHLYYKLDDKYYKVPTYGRIFKIIDFGRSIYRYNGQLCHNDSYAVGNDAAGQYNFEPYYTDSKQRIMPNQSFDLCRLGCSMYDNFFDFTVEEDNVPEDELLVKLIADWCKDDKGKNVLYKKSGEERYEGFKLYKMIARMVHGCVPREEVKKRVFSEYVMKKASKKDVSVIDIDAIPCYV